jgi:hypothetical protein
VSHPSPSVGRMISHGLDAVPTVNRKAFERTRHEAMARGMLDHLLHNRRARRTFTRRILGLDSEVPAFRMATRTTSDVFDLIAQAGADTSLTAVVALKLIVDGPLDNDRVRRWLGSLGPDPSSRLMLIVPRSRRDELGVADPRLMLVTWAQIAKRLTERDVDRAELWLALSEFGEMEAVADVRQPVAPKILLDEDVTSRFREHLQTFLLASRTLIGRAPRFSSSRSHPHAWLHAGGSGNDLGIEFGAVEDGTALWLVGQRPGRSFPLRLGALEDEGESAAAEARLRAIAALSDWRHDPAPRIETEEFIGRRAGRDIEDVRALLWEVFDPTLLEDAGFPLLPRQQPDLDEDRLAVRVHAPGVERSGTFLVAVGGSRTWRTLLPRVTREFDGRTYVVQAKKSDTAQDLVTAVHEALHSLATKP